MLIFGTMFYTAILVVAAITGVVAGIVGFHITIAIGTLFGIEAYYKRGDFLFLILLPLIAILTYQNAGIIEFLPELMRADTGMIADCVGGGFFFIVVFVGSVSPEVFLENMGYISEETQRRRTSIAYGKPKTVHSALKLAPKITVISNSNTDTDCDYITPSLAPTSTPVPERINLNPIPLPVPPPPIPTTPIPAPVVSEPSLPTVTAEVVTIRPVRPYQRGGGSRRL